MELQTQYQTFNSMLNQFLKLNQAYTVKGDAQRLSKELTIFAQRQSFLDIAIQLLTTQPAKKDKAIFVTSLIKDKFKFDFELVQTEKLLYYYHQLCELGHRLGCQYHTVYTNISLALAYIYLHISSRSDEDLNVFLSPFVPTDQKDYKFFNYYFKIVEMLVVQVQNSRFVIDQQNRQIAKNKLVQQQYAILHKLNENSPIAWTIPEIDNENIMQCFTQWVCLGYNFEVLNSLPQHFLMNKMFEYVRDENHTKQTAESLRILVKYIGKPQDLPVLFEYLGTKMVQLLNVIDYFCENVEFTEAEDFFEIVAQFSKKSIPSFVRNFDDRIYDFLSKICSYTQNELVSVFESCLQFWQLFLQQINKQKGVITPNPKIFILMQEVYLAVCKRCKYPLKVIIQLDKIPQNKLYDHNYSAEQIFNKREGTDLFFKQLGQFIGQTAFVKLAYTKIQSISQSTDDKLWPYLQVYLLSMVQPLKKVKILPSEMNDIVGIYLELQKKQNFVLPIILRKTFLKIFKSIMGAQHKDVNFVKLIFSLTASCFNQPMLFSYAQRTFEKGCQLNAAIMKENLGEMVSLIQQYPGHDHIVKGIIYLLSHSSQAAIQYLPSVLTFLFEKIQTAINSVVQKHLMHSLIGVVKVLNEQVPQSQVYKGILVAFIRAIFPFVLKALKQPKLIQNDEDPEVQRMVKFLKLSMRYLKFDFTEFIDPLYTCVLQTFTQYPLCSYAYLIEIAITVYYDDPRYTEYFKAVYVKFCGILYGHMKQMENMQKYCYLLDDFIGMSKRFFVCNASIVLSSGELPRLIELCTTAFVGCDTPRIARASYSFFETIFMVYWRKQFIDRYNSNDDDDRQKFSYKESDQALYAQLKVLLLEKLQFILSRIFDHLLQIPNESTRQYIIQVFLSEIKAFPQENMIIWPKLLHRLPAYVLVANQKTRMTAHLEYMMNPDFKIVFETSRFMKKYIFLMTKRLVNANNRGVGF